MSAPELRATVSLAAIFALRMLGLFMIMPVFSIYAKTIPGGDNVLFSTAEFNDPQHFTSRQVGPYTVVVRIS